MDSDMMRVQACAVPFISLVTAFAFKTEFSSKAYSPLKYIPIIYGVVLLFSIFNFYNSKGSKTIGRFYTPATFVTIDSNQILLKVMSRFLYPEVTDKLNTLNLSKPFKLTIAFDLKSKQNIWLIFPITESYNLYRTEFCTDIGTNIIPYFFPLKACNF
jgi:hypothetical protein